MIDHDKLHKCRVAGPCWGCGGEIRSGQYYRSMVTWSENGPRRTRRLHPSCHAELSTFTIDDWETFSPGDLDPLNPKQESK